MKYLSPSLLSAGLLLAGSLVITLPAAASTVIYRETFGNAKTSNTYLTDSTNIHTDWKVYSTTTAVNGSAARSVISNVANSAGAGGLPNIGTGYTETSQTNGVAFTDSMNVNWLFMTTGHAGNLIDIDPAQGLTFSWFQGDANATDGLRLTVQVAGNWYVTNTLFTTPALGSTSLAEKTWSFTNDATQWSLLNFTSGSTLGVDSTALTGTLPSGNITGFGVYIDPNTSYVRFDNFSIVSSVPEPSTALLLSVFGLLLGLRSTRYCRR